MSILGKCKKDKRNPIALGIWVPPLSREEPCSSRIMGLHTRMKELHGPKAIKLLTSKKKPHGLMAIELIIFLLDLLDIAPLI